MHGVDEIPMTGVRGTHVVNGSSAPGPGALTAVTRSTSAILASKSLDRLGVATPISGAGLTVGQQGTGSVLNIMSRQGTVQNGTPNGTPLSLPLQQGMQIVNMRAGPNQGIQMASTRGISPRMIINQIPNSRPGQTGLTLQTIQGIAPGTGGHLIVKTDNGQLQLVRVNPMPTSQSGQVQPPNGTPGTTNAVVLQHTSNNDFRLQSSGVSHVLSNHVSAPSQVVTAGGQTMVVVSTATTAASSSMVASSQSNTVSQPVQVPPQTATGGTTISAESAKTKCKNFLATLLRLASEQRAKVAQNVRNLIQGLIDGKVEPEAFTEELQKDLNSSPQPCLVPFLKKTLPFLRASLARGELTIDGVRPPPLSSVTPVTGMTTVIPSMVGIVRSPTPSSISQVRMINAVPAHPGSPIPRVATPAVVTQQLQNTPTQPPNNSRVVTVQQVRLSKARANSSSTTSSMAATTTSVTSTSAMQPQSVKSKPNVKEDKKKEKGATVFNNSFSASSAGDDDINDVAAMGGVNLGEESQRILDSTGFVGTQIRSVKDEMFLMSNIVSQRIKAICTEHGLEEPGKDALNIVSQATQERLKGIVEKLAVVAEHRLDLIRSEPRYEVVQDVRGQLRFLEELDKLEKKRKDEQEREMLLRAAKSRSKSEDPEQVKLKAKAKEMQRVEMEEMRQRDANQTALKALQGPKKKAKIDNGAVEDTSTYSGTFTNKQMPLRPRIKRVNLRDLVFVMEQEREMKNTDMLFRTHLK